MIRDLQLEFLECIRRNCLIISVGQKGTGKSTHLSQLIKFYMKHNIFKEYIVISPSFKTDPALQFLLKSKGTKITIYEGFFMNILKQFKMDGIKKLLVIDDFTAVLSKQGNQDFTHFLITLRHLSVSTHLVSHGLKSIGLVPTIRNTVDIFFIFRNSNRQMLETLYNENYSLHYNKDEFLKFFRDQQRFDLIALHPDTNSIDLNANDWHITK